jgi:hypothetical protein
MLGFKQYKISLKEQEKPATSAPAPKQMGAEGQKLASEIDKVIDQWVADLKKDLLSGSLSSPKMGLWDRLKGSLSNLWYGRRNTDNPQYYRNQFGDLGRMESNSNGLPLSEYKSLRKTVENAEASIVEATGDNAERLKLFQIINQKAMQLKQSLRNAITASMPQKYEMPPLSSFPAKPAAAIAGATPAAEKTTEKKTEQKPATKPEVVPVDVQRPPTENLPWERLSKADKEKWNDYGGGSSPSSGRFKLFPLPLILRIGDPRLEILYPDLRKKLEDAKRIESPEKPITSKDELDKAMADSSRASLSTAERSSRGAGRPETRPQVDPVERSPEADRPDTSAKRPEEGEDLMDRDAGNNRFDSNAFDYNDTAKERSDLRDLIAAWPDSEEKKSLTKLVERPLSKDKALRALTQVKNLMKGREEALDASGEDGLFIKDLIANANTVQDFLGILTAMESLEKPIS